MVNDQLQEMSKMASINKVILIGNLGTDPTFRHFEDGSGVANISLATTESWKDKNGAKQEKTEWHKVVFYRKLADIVSKYLTKGSSVYVEGRLETRKWTDKEGVEKYSTEIIANNMQMLGAKPETKPSKSNTPFQDMDSDCPF